MIYMDHNATTPLDPKVLDAMMPYMGEHYGNASSVHSIGRKAREALENAREIVADLIGASAREIIFTSGGTEADNLAVIGVALEHLSQPKHGTGCLVASQIEHKAVLEACQTLPRMGIPMLYAPVTNAGMIEPEQIRMATKGMKRKLILLSLMHANNETGTIQPVQEASKIAHEMGALVHTDAVQTLGKIPVNVDDLGVDLLSMSGHKIYGPKGIGALYVRQGAELRPQIVGGHQERSMRGGTENVAAIVGFGKAAELAAKGMEKDPWRLFDLTAKLWDGIQEALSDVQLNGDPDKRLPNTLNLSFRGVYNEALLLLLDAEGFAASTGSACTSGSLEPSHVLHAMGCDALALDGAVRFSLGRANTGADVLALLDILPGMVKELRDVRGAQIDHLAERLRDTEVLYAVEKEEIRGPGTAD